MYLSSLLTLITLVGAALAAPADRDRQSPSSLQCYTRVGKTYVARPTTKLTTTTKPCTSTVTTTSTSTVVPTSLTSTVTASTVTTVAAPTSTSTATTTTFISTSITTTTTTFISTTTTTTTTSVPPTVPAPVNFLPIQTSLPGTTYQGSGGPVPAQKREAQQGEFRDRDRINGRNRDSNKSFPQAVTCVGQASSSRCTTVTSTQVTTITAPTGTTTVTSTTTQTTTVFPDATTTTTITTFSISTETASTTSLATSTEIQTTVTGTNSVYAACATNNLADRYLGEPVYYFEGTDSIDIVRDVPTAYDCCVLAFTSQTPYGAWTYDTVTDPNVFAVQGSCYLGFNNVCAAGVQSNLYTLLTNNPPTGVMGNGACGIATNGRPY